jgi:hypothetical protein
MTMTARRITLTGEHGQYQTTPEALDIMIGRYLPASVESLQREIRERSGDATYTIKSVVEGLMILQEYDGYATN